MPLRDALTEPMCAEGWIVSSGGIENKQVCATTLLAAFLEACEGYDGPLGAVIKFAPVGLRETSSNTYYGLTSYYIRQGNLHAL